MANKKLVEVVKKGRGAIALFRKKYPKMNLDLVDAKLSQTDLRGANLRKADLVGADLSEANLSGANLSEADLTRGNLRGANLKNAILSKTDLFKATLGGSNLTGANLKRANLISADLAEAFLKDTNLVEAVLKDATFREARLFGVDFGKADFDQTNFSEAKFGWVSFGNVDLSTVTGLDTVTHIGPSTLAIDTFYRSLTGISEEFLRGCGVPEDFVSNISSLTERPFEFGPHFVTYSHEDTAIAKRIYELLQSKGVRCWLDQKPRVLRSDQLPEKIDRGVRLWDKILLIASKHSLTSWWIEHEVDNALFKERVLKQKTGKDIETLLPLNLDGFMFSGDWKNPNEKKISSRSAADFVGWRRNKTKLDEECDKLAKKLIGDDKVKKKLWKKG